MLFNKICTFRDMWESGDFIGLSFCLCSFLSHAETAVVNKDLFEDLRRRQFDLAIVDVLGNGYGLGLAR